MAGERGRVVDAVAAVDVYGHRQAVRGGGLPDRLEHRLAVGLPRLQRHPDLHHLRMVGQPFDLGDRTLDVLGVDPDRAAEPAGGVGLEPAIEQPVVDRRADPAVEQVVGDVAARQRVEDRVVDTALVEQVPGHGVRVGARIAVAVQILAVVAAGRLVPLLLDVGDRAQLVRGRQVAPDLRVVAEMRLDVRVDDRALMRSGYTCPSVTSTS